MQNLQDYFSQLSKRDRILLFTALALFTFIFYKIFILDNLTAQSKKLDTRAALVQEQSEIMKSIQNTNGTQNRVVLSSNKLINDFLKQHSITDKLKQIRTTNSGEQRFEIEEIEFNKLLELLNALEQNNSTYSNLQIKSHKNPGTVNTILTLPN